ncbi:glycosyltransferase [Cognatitamlana onchidii]|uniref:glycosyltransferase n=1 Tax=Cognatitamlana onchidii TaxID=2562860 RepID=UPI0010A5CEB4|nr:glycosyltransferase [Algibacter onchidii]
MKKVAFIIESLYHGGAEKSLVTLLNLLDYSKMEVDLILFRKGGEFEKFVPKEINIIYTTSFQRISFPRKLYGRFKYWIIKKILNDKNYHHAQIYWSIFGDLISSFNKKYDVAIAYNQGFSTYYVAQKLNADKKFAWLNTDYQKAGYAIQFDYKFYTSFEKIICVSKENESAFAEANKSIGKSLYTDIIKDISDELLIKQMSKEKLDIVLSKDCINILTVGRLAKPKALDLAIEACSILKNKGVKLKWYVIGEGSERSTLENAIKNHQLENDFHLLGYRDNPYPLIKACDIYVQSSLFEGLGLTVIEAAILQKPIVSTNFPTASSIITHNETGLICEMNANAIADNISIYIENLEFKERIVDALSKLKNNDKEKSLLAFYDLLLN